MKLRALAFASTFAAIALAPTSQALAKCYPSEAQVSYSVVEQESPTDPQATVLACLETRIVPCDHLRNGRKFIRVIAVAEDFLDLPVQCRLLPPATEGQ